MRGRLGKLEVAGADRADTWSLATELRRTVTRHHDEAFKRHLTQKLIQMQSE